MPMTSAEVMWRQTSSQAHVILSFACGYHFLIFSSHQDTKSFSLTRIMTRFEQKFATTNPRTLPSYQSLLMTSFWCHIACGRQISNTRPCSVCLVLWPLTFTLLNIVSQNSWMLVTKIHQFLVLPEKYFKTNEMRTLNKLKHVPYLFNIDAPNWSWVSLSHQY